MNMYAGWNNTRKLCCVKFEWWRMLGIEVEHIIRMIYTETHSLTEACKWNLHAGGSCVVNLMVWWWSFSKMCGNGNAGILIMIMTLKYESNKNYWDTVCRLDLFLFTFCPVNFSTRKVCHVLKMIMACRHAIVEYEIFVCLARKTVRACVALWQLRTHHVFPSTPEPRMSYLF